VGFGQGCHQSGVSFVADQADGAAIGYCQVGARDPDPRREETVAESCAGDFDQGRDIRRAGVAGFTGE
jgi:hypothetical protein